MIIEHFFQRKKIFFQRIILMKIVEMKLRIIKKKCSRFRDTISQKIVFTTYGLHRDHPPAKIEFLDLQAFWTSEEAHWKNLSWKKCIYFWSGPVLLLSTILFIEKEMKNFLIQIYVDRLFFHKLKTGKGPTKKLFPFFTRSLKKDPKYPWSGLWARYDSKWSPHRKFWTSISPTKWNF